MTTGLKHFRFGALTAAASMLIGASAAAAGIYALNDPLAFTTRPVLTPPSAQAPAADGDIRSSWTAPIAEAMTVDLRAPVSGAQPLRAHLSRAVATSRAEPSTEPTCTPRWHRMAEGPSGRHVANICPGDDLLPLPAGKPRTTPALTMLPTLRVLGSPLRNQPLDPDDMPRQDPSAVASMRAFDQTLTGRFEASAPHDFDRPLPDSATAIRDPAPLDWAPRVAVAKTPADTAHQCNPDRQC